MMKESDLPGFFHAASSASLKAQRYFLMLMIINLTCGIIAAGIAIYNFQSDYPKIIIYIGSLMLLIASIAVTIIVKYTKYQDFWYQGRALAESIKTLMWRYITASENFEINLPEEEAKKKYVSALQSLSKAFPELITFLDNSKFRQSDISTEMERVRFLAWQDRLGYYLQHRIHDQKDWYQQKANINKRMKNRWQIVIFSAQTMALICCLCLIFQPKSNWNFIGLFTTIATAAIAWLELKQHKPLLQAYMTASLELRQIEILGATVKSEAELVKYVLDSENAISREHTMWLAQRRK